MSPNTTRPQPEFLLIGRILGTFGWAGAVKVIPETDFPERFADLSTVLVEFPTGERRELHVVSSHIAPKQLRVKFAEYTNKEEAAALRGCQILIPLKEATKLQEGQYYLHQILGLLVKTTGGEELGEIIEVIQSPANDVYVTPKAMIPAVKNAVKEIDLERGTMLVEAEGIVER